MSQNYAALIIDLKKSRSYTKEDRNNIQHYIMDVIHLLNCLYCRELVREVDFSAGDEVQGLFLSPEAAYFECSLYVCILLRFVQVLVLVVGMSNLITRVLLVKMDQLTTKHDML